MCVRGVEKNESLAAECLGLPRGAADSCCKSAPPPPPQPSPVGGPTYAELPTVPAAAAAAGVAWNCGCSSCCCLPRAHHAGSDISLEASSCSCAVMEASRLHTALSSACTHHRQSRERWRQSGICCAVPVQHSDDACPATSLKMHNRRSSTMQRRVRASTHQLANPATHASNNQPSHPPAAAACG